MLRIGLAILCGGLVTAAAVAESSRVPVGAQVGDLHFKDIRYITRSLSDLGEAKATVLVFTNTTCPIAQKYWPRLKQLWETHRDHGVVFAAVNASDGDTIAEVAQQGLDFGVPFPVVKDTDGSVCRALGIERTPEVVVLDSQRRIRYRGRIDDQYRLGGSQPAVTSEDLSDAIKAVLVGGSPPEAKQLSMAAASHCRHPSSPPAPLRSPNTLHLCSTSTAWNVIAPAAAPRLPSSTLTTPAPTRK